MVLPYYFTFSYKIYRFREAIRRAGEKNPQDLRDLARLRAGDFFERECP